jgi:hypothetical protein
MQSENTADLSAALAKAQAVMKSATFDKTNPHFKNKYASLAAVIEAIRKPLADNGLSYTQTTEVREGGFVLVTTLHHASGQWIAGEYPLPVGVKPQELGSALTYARRYSLSAIACIAADEDDDAEGARTNGQTASAPKAKPSAVKPAPVAAPIDPQTGECSPHKITAADEMAWGGLYVAAINMARDETEIKQWQDANKDNLEALESAAPKVYARVVDRVNEKIALFKQKAA